MTRLWRKIIGHKFDNRYKWGEFYWRLHPKYWNLSLKFTDRYSELTDLLVIEPLLFSAYIYLPTKICAIRDRGDQGDGKSYGFYVYPSVKNSDTLVLCWNRWSKHIDLPWTYKWFSTEILDFNYNPVYYEDRHTKKTEDWEIRWNKEEKAKQSVEQQYDYTYTRKSGEVQRRKATVYVQRMVWTMRWLPLKKMTRTSIWVTFNEGIGENVDSWKGGVTGCGTEIKAGETPEVALRRMEKEEKFCR